MFLSFCSYSGYSDYDPAARAWRWKIRSKHLIINKDQKLGEGRFGIVYRGYLHGTPVAIKVLNNDSTNMSNLEYEVGIMR
jgi:predicted Ser/Thr protein kinase